MTFAESRGYTQLDRNFACGSVQTGIASIYSHICMVVYKAYNESNTCLQIAKLQHDINCLTTSMSKFRVFTDGQDRGRADEL